MIPTPMARRFRSKGLLTLGALLLLSAFLLLFSGPARAARQDFTLHNSTGMVIDELYVSRHSSNHWGSDLLGNRVLRNGGSEDITFPSGEDEDEWDLKVIDENGDKHEFYDLDLSKISKLTLHMKDDGTMEATW